MREHPPTEYVVKTSSACMPSSCWGRYGRIAVLEVRRDRGEDEPKMISEHARCVVRVVKVWERLHIGTTDRCAFAKALAKAKSLANELNGSTAPTVYTHDGARYW